MFESSNSKGVETWRKKIAGRFESKDQYLIPALQYIQGQEGYLPPEAMEAAARHLRMPKSKVFGVASFYAQFNFKPQGRHKITICRGTACHVRGSARLLAKVEENLGVHAGETTEDMSFTLETVACFGACALAPVAVVDGKVSGNQTVSKLKQSISDARAMDSGKPGHKSTVRIAGNRASKKNVNRQTSRKSSGRKGRK
ncbi:MAG: NAD(P)H-dependent oxidoreductase subunit E [Deltaproteobacteria bacterium]|nr:NAD(P)H-dependent oxidoreductase subunit E [Deltaproteobacteria bacterium]